MSGSPLTCRSRASPLLVDGGADGGGDARRTSRYAHHDPGEAPGDRSGRQEPQHSGVSAHPAEDRVGALAALDRDHCVELESLHVSPPVCVVTEHDEPDEMNLAIRRRLCNAYCCRF